MFQIVHTRCCVYRESLWSCMLRASWLISIPSCFTGILVPHQNIKFIQKNWPSQIFIFSNSQVKESKWLVKCFLNYLRHEKSEMNVLFDVLLIFLFHSRIDYTFLREFYIIEVSFSKFHAWFSYVAALVK